MGAPEHILEPVVDATAASVEDFDVPTRFAAEELQQSLPGTGTIGGVGDLIQRTDGVKPRRPGFR